MKTAKASYRTELSSIHARIGDMLGDAWGKIPVTTRPSSKTPSPSCTHAQISKCQPASPRLWNETLAFAADG